MKAFFQSLLGSLTAFAIIVAGGIAACFVLIAAMASIGEQALVEVAPGSVLVFDLNTTIHDAPLGANLEDALQQAISGQAQPATYLLKVLDAIARAKTDADISALLLHGNLMQSGFGSGLAAVSEIREALADFKTSGKPIYAYLVSPTQKDYYLASVADDIWVNPFGTISLNGLATNAPFLGDTLQKYGIGVQTTRVGDYKSAVELFTRTSMSDADREQMTTLLNDIWRTLLAEMSHSRQIDLQAMTQLSNQKAFFNAHDAQIAQLVDTIGYLDELIDHLADTHEYSQVDETFQQIDLIDYAGARGFELDTTTKTGTRIAIVYAEGEIVAGSYLPKYIAGDWLASELRRLRHDDEVKAVVLRVNSPGGSALASEVIQRETRLLAAQKPLIVSMGSYAASGGYWIAAYAEKIYAQPYTITGSIGVFGLVFNFEQAAENFAIQFDGVKTSPFADIFSATRPRSDAEMALIQKFTDEIYDAFIAKVAEGRGLETSQVRELAQGRIWSGVSAQRLSLVDAMGGLNAAIAAAARSGGLGELRIEQVPSPATLTESITLLLKQVGAAPVAKSLSALEQISTEIEALTKQIRGLNDPRGIYTRMPYGLEGL
jgi:protease-4